LIKIIIKEENFKWHLEAFASELFIYIFCIYNNNGTDSATATILIEITNVLKRQTLMQLRNLHYRLPMHYWLNLKVKKSDSLIHIKKRSITKGSKDLHHRVQPLNIWPFLI